VTNFDYNQCPLNTMPANQLTRSAPETAPGQVSGMAAAGSLAQRFGRTAG
jgi:hypothetical protein